MSNKGLNSNQLPITKDVSTNKLRSLERRATKRLRYFANKQNFHHKIYDKQMVSNKPVDNGNLLQLINCRRKIKFWEKRLRSITDELAERYLLQD
jgi:hypothetical protein